MDQLDVPPSESPLAPVREAATWLTRGQALEAEAKDAPALVEAIRSYDCAIALLRPVAGTDLPARRDLAIALMNRANALQKAGTPESLADAVRTYDETTKILSAPEFQAHNPSLNTLGAAWMNRGHAQHRQGTPESLSAALTSHQQAVSVLGQLALEPSENLTPEAALNHRLNLAGAWMNLANVYLGDTNAPQRYLRAREAAIHSLNTLGTDDIAMRHPVAAELTLLAHRAHCDVLGQVLPLVADPETAKTLSAEASDSVDAALALDRHTEKHGLRHFRPIAQRLFYFGTQLYRVNQPHFLAEFILEHLDPERSEGAVADDPTLYGIAEEAIAAVLQSQQQSQSAVFDATTPAAQRQLETNRDLKAASARLTELRNKYLPPTVA